MALWTVNIETIVPYTLQSCVFSLQGFGDILNIVPLAESVIKLNAVCMHCYNEASYTKRIGCETAVS